MVPADSYVTHDVDSRMTLHVWRLRGGDAPLHAYRWQYGDGATPCEGSHHGDHCATVEHAIAQLRKLRAESRAINARLRAQG